MGSSERAFPPGVFDDGPGGLRDLAHLIGRTLGGSYKIVAPLDRGGMGVVFLAEHVRLHRSLAVKVIARHLSTDSRALARFENEAEIVSRLEHPHIVQIMDFDRTPEGQPFIVMELLHGESLAARLGREPVLPVGEAVRIAGQIASGLVAVHRAGIVHRDLKPENVFLVENVGELPFVKLLDFGISKSARDSGRLTFERDLLGTPFYMAPEQATGEGLDIDHRADQFALGAMIYEMLAGRAAFAADSVMAVLARILEARPTPLRTVAPWVPEAIETVVNRALAKDRYDRYPDMASFSTALAAAATEAPAVAGRPTPERGARPRQVTMGRAGESGPGRPMGALVVAALESARAALERGELEAAFDAAEESIALGGRAGRRGIALLSGAARTLERIFEANAGPLDATLEPVPDAVGARMTPPEAFMVSRLDGPMTAQDLVDIAAVPRPQAVRMVARLLRRGILRRVTPPLATAPAGQLAIGR